MLLVNWWLHLYGLTRSYELALMITTDKARFLGPWCAETVDSNDNKSDLGDSSAITTARRRAPYPLMGDGYEETRQKETSLKLCAYIRPGRGKFYRVRSQLTRVFRDPKREIKPADRAGETKERKQRKG